MGMAMRMRISQRMYQHIIIRLFTENRISEPPVNTLPYRVSMFIARHYLFVKRFFCKKTFC